MLVADGSEEIETLGTVDVLRRAGLYVVLASVNEQRVVMSRGVTVEADTTVASLCEQSRPRAWQAIVVPGGMPGAANIAACASARSLVVAQNEAGRLVAAICAAPVVVLQAWGILDREGARATCHPSFEPRLAEKGTFAEGRVVQDGNIITSRAPGTTIEFALAIVERLCGKETADKVARPMLVCFP